MTLKLQSQRPLHRMHKVLRLKIMLKSYNRKLKTSTNNFNHKVQITH